MINQFRKGILMKYRINMSNIFGRLCELLNSFVQLYTRYILHNIKYSHDFDFALSEFITAYSQYVGGVSHQTLYSRIMAACQSQDSYHSNSNQMSPRSVCLLNVWEHCIYSIVSHLIVIHGFQRKLEHFMPSS